MQITASQVPTYYGRVWPAEGKKQESKSGIDPNNAIAPHPNQISHPKKDLASFDVKLNRPTPPRRLLKLLVLF